MACKRRCWRGRHRMNIIDRIWWACLITESSHYYGVPSLINIFQVGTSLSNLQYQLNSWLKLEPLTGRGSAGQSPTSEPRVREDRRRRPQNPTIHIAVTMACSSNAKATPRAVQHTHT